MGLPHRSSTLDRGRSGDTGQATVEFALIAVVLVPLLLGTVDLARAFATYVSMINAAYEGARYCAANPTGFVTPVAVGGPTPVSPWGRVVTELGTPVPTPGGTPPASNLGPAPTVTSWVMVGTGTPTPAPITNCPTAQGGQAVTVLVEYPFKPITPFVCNQIVTVCDRNPATNVPDRITIRAAATLPAMQ